MSFQDEGLRKVAILVILHWFVRDNHTQQFFCQKAFMNWTRFEVSVAPELQEAVTDFFLQQGSNGVVLEERGVEAVAVIAYFPEDKGCGLSEALNSYLSCLQEVFPEVDQAVVSVSETPDEKWAVAWKDYFKPIPIGRGFVVTPPWLFPDPCRRQVIVIEPAEAFGTGTHETTQSCMILLENAVDRLELKGKTWDALDVGCGSGILAIAAYRLGAESVLGVDNDPKAIASATHNARLNEIRGSIEFACCSVDSLKARADVVTANLDVGTLTSYSGMLASLAIRCLVISGVSAEMWPIVKQSFERQGLILEEEIVSQEWGSGLLVTSRNDLFTEIDAKLS